MQVLKSYSQHASDKQQQVAQIRFLSYFHIFSPIYPNNCGVVFFVKLYCSFWEKSFFVRRLKYANFHPEYYPSCDLV